MYLLEDLLKLCHYYRTSFGQLQIVCTDLVILFSRRALLLLFCCLIFFHEHCWGKKAEEDSYPEYVHIAYESCHGGHSQKDQTLCKAHEWTFELNDLSDYLKEAIKTEVHGNDELG